MTVDLPLPPGFRFHPTDEELVYHYLCPKCASQRLSVPIIAEIDLYKYDPWQLPGLSLYGEKEWFFFSPRDRKYPNGSRPNRAAGSGYWKATGADKPVGNPHPKLKRVIGPSISCSPKHYCGAYYYGKAPRGEKTNWIMHEYRLADVDRSVRKKNSLRLDDWVLCRIYNKKGHSTHTPEKAKQSTAKNVWEYSGSVLEEEEKPQVTYHTGPNKPEGLGCNGLTRTEYSGSIPRLQPESPSSSGHGCSPELTCDREVESQLKWTDEWESVFDTESNNTLESFLNCSFPQMGEQHFPPPMMFREPSFNEVLMYLQ